MCGFVLAYFKNPEGRLAQTTLDILDRAICHRGPDEHGQKQLGRVAIGHRRLAIIDLVGGKQPMVSADGRYWLTYNGEIYNFQEVRRELEALGHVFKEHGDTEVLLVAWQVWGEACLDRLNGMFAFAIYDAARGTIVAVRDRFGEKPLYYIERDDAVYLASELKALVAAGLTDKQIDPSALYSYFTLGYVTGQQSIFRDVQRLLPGHLLTFSANEPAVQRAWWRPPRPTEELSDRPSVVARSLELLSESVKMRMVADVPVGFFLSGGVDSSAIVALASQVAPGKLETFSIGFDDPRLDERPHARFVAERFSTNHHEFVLTPQNLDMLERIAWHADEPFADQAVLPTWFLSELTRKHVTVALSGDGGDEMFAGYDVYRSHELSETVRKIPAPMRSFAISAMRGAARLSEPDRWLRLARNVEDAGLSAVERFIAKQQQVFRSDFLRSASPLLASAEKATNKKTFEALYALGDFPLGAIAWWQQTASLPDDMLHKVDRMTMAHSLEVRAPFLDHRLAELLNRTAFSAKLPEGRQKYILRKAVSGLLPDDFLWRRKQGFVVPLSRWFKGDLLQFARDELLSPGAVSRAILAPGIAERILAEHANGRELRDKPLWALLMFEQWCRAFKIGPECLPHAA